MEPLLSCIPCIIKQTIYSARAVSSDTWLQKQVVSQALKGLSEIEYSVLPVTLVNRIYKDAVDSLGVSDPFAEQKKELITRMPELLKSVAEVGAAMPCDELEAALRLSIAATHFPGFIGLDDTLQRIYATAAEEPLIFSLERFSKEYQKTNKAVLIAGGFLELLFDLHLLNVMGMEEVVIAAGVKPLLWQITADEIRSLGEQLPIEYEVREIALNKSKRDYDAIIGEGEFAICKGFINYQYFIDYERPVVHMYYTHRWCQPAMVALGLKNKPASGMVMKFNV